MTSSTTPAEAPPLPTRPPPTFAAALRPISVGAIVQGSLSVWWRNALKFGALTLLLFVPLIIAAAAGAAMMRAPGGAPFTARLRGAEVILVAAFPITIVMSVAQMGAVTYGAVQHLAGRPVRFGAMLAAGLRRLLPVVAACVAAGAMVCAAFLLLIVPAFVVGCAVTVTVPTAVIERIGPIEAVRRSWALTRDHRLVIFGAWLAIGAVSFGANMALQLVAVLFGSMAPAAALIALPFYLLVATLPTVLPAVAYHELRAAKEGVATEELAKVFD